MKSTILILAFFISFVSFIACNNAGNSDNSGIDSADTTNTAKDNVLNPSTPKPDWAPDIDDAMWAVLVKLQSFNAPPLETLTPAEARKQPTPTDAVNALISEGNINVPAAKVDTSGKD